MRLPPYLSLYITGAVALLVEMPMSVVEVLNKPSGWKFNERNELISTLKLKFVLNFLIFILISFVFYFFYLTLVSLPILFLVLRCHSHRDTRNRMTSHKSPIYDMVTSKQCIVSRGDHKQKQ